MKKLVLLLSAVIFVGIVYGQEPEWFGFAHQFTEEQIRERDAIVHGNGYQSGDIYEQFRNAYDPEREREIREKIANAIQSQLSSYNEEEDNSNVTTTSQSVYVQTSGGLQMTSEPDSHRTSSQSAAQQKAKKEQMDAKQRQEILEAQRKNDERRQKDLENQRIWEEKLEKERQEQQRRHDTEYAKAMKSTEPMSRALNNKLDYRATVGRDYMLNATAPGAEDYTEYIYDGSSGKPKVSAAEIIDAQRQKAKYNNQNIIKPFEGKYYAGGTSNWDKAMDAELIKNKIDNLPHVKNIYEKIAATDTGMNEIIDYKIVPIANGCGTGSADDVSRKAAVIANIGDKTYSLYKRYIKKQFDYNISDVHMYDYSENLQIRACNQHDLDYYYGVPKKEADDKFSVLAPIKSVAVKILGQGAYDSAQTERQMSEYIQRKFNVSDKEKDFYHMLVPIRKSDKK